MKAEQRVFYAQATDVRGTVTICIAANPDGKCLDMTATWDDGDRTSINGMTIPREDVLALDRGLMNWLIDTAPDLGET